MKFFFHIYVHFGWFILGVLLEGILLSSTVWNIFKTLLTYYISKLLSRNECDNLNSLFQHMRIPISYPLIAHCVLGLSSSFILWHIKEDIFLSWSVNLYFFYWPIKIYLLNLISIFWIASWCQLPMTYL